MGKTNSTKNARIMRSGQKRAASAPGCAYCYFFFFLPASGFLYSVWSCGAERAQQSLGFLRVRAIRSQLQIFLESFRGSGNENRLPVLVQRRFGHQGEAILIEGLGVWRRDVDRLLERFAGRIVLAGVYFERAQVVIILARAGRVEGGGFLEFGLRLGELLARRQRQRVVVMEAGIVGVEGNRFGPGISRLLHVAVKVGARLGLRQLLVSLSQARPYGALPGVDFPRLVEVLDGRVVLLVVHSGLARVISFVQRGVLLHVFFLLGDVLLDRLLLLGSHAAFLFFGDAAAAVAAFCMAAALSAAAFRSKFTILLAVGLVFTPFIWSFSTSPIRHVTS